MFGEDMELTVNQRPDTKKGTTNKLKLQGFIPAVLYGAKEENENIYISKHEFEAHLRQLKKGRLSTCVFTLIIGKKKVKVIVKGIQYQVTSYAIEHLDFERLDEKKPVNVKVPIECVGMDECEGIKHGGVLRQVIRKLKVSCLPKNIPEVFVIDVRNLLLNHSIKLSQITLPKEVSPIAQMEEVAVVIAKR